MNLGVSQALLIGGKRILKVSVSLAWNIPTLLTFLKAERIVGLKQHGLQQYQTEPCFRWVILLDFLNQLLLRIAVEFRPFHWKKAG